MGVGAFQAPGIGSRGPGVVLGLPERPSLRRQGPPSAQRTGDKRYTCSLGMAGSGHGHH